MGLGTANHRTRGIDTSKISVSVLCLLVLLSYVQVEDASQFNLLSLTSTLHSTEYGLKFAYDGETVRFNCIAMGNSMAWSSDEYIGSDGNRLEFVSIEPKGTEYRAGQTVATLISISNMNGSIMLKSQLQISVQSAFQISSIRCHNIGSDTVNTISFETNGNTSITCDQRSACPGETVRCTCITGYSNTLAWSSDLLIGPNDARLEFVSIDTVNTTYQVVGSNTRAVLTDISRLNGVVVLSSDLIFIIDNHANILTCENVGQQRSYSIIIPMSTNCVTVSTPSLSINATTDLAASTITDIIHASSSSRSDNSNVTIGVSVLFSTVIVVLSAAIIMLVIKIIHIKKPYKKVNVLDSCEDHRDMDLDSSTFSTRNDSKRTESDSKEDTSQEEPTQEESTNALSVGVETKESLSMNTNPTNILTPVTVSPEDGRIEKRRTEDTVKPKHSRETNHSEQSKSEGGAAGLPCTQFSAEESKEQNENEIVSDVDMMALVAAVKMQKETFHEVQERNEKKKFIDTLMEDVFENTRNNAEDAAGGLKKRTH